MQEKELLKLKVNLIIVEKTSKNGNPYKDMKIQIGDYNSDLYKFVSDEQYFILSQFEKSQSK